MSYFTVARCHGSRMSGFINPCVRAFHSSNYIVHGNLTGRFSASDRTVCVFHESSFRGADRVEPNLDLLNAKRLESRFLKHTSNVKLVGKEELGNVLRTSRKVTLVVSDRSVEVALRGLQGLVEAIRRAAELGHLNYYGINGGAIIAGYGCVLHKDSKLVRDDSFLQIAPITPFRTPLLPEEKFNGDSILAKYWNTHKFKVNDDSGPSLKIVTPEMIHGLSDYQSELIRKQHTVLSVAKYVKNGVEERNNAAVRGTCGKGRYFLQTHCPSSDRYCVDDISDQLSEMCIKETDHYVLGSEI